MDYWTKRFADASNASQADFDLLLQEIQKAVESAPLLARWEVQTGKWEVHPDIWSRLRSRNSRSSDHD